MSGEEIYFSVSMGVFALVYIVVPALVGLFIVVTIIRRARLKGEVRQSLGGLLVALLIVLIWEAVYIRGFFKFSAPAKQVGSKNNLSAIFIAQQRYFTDYRMYAGGPQAFNLLDWKPEEGGKYAFFCGDDYIPNQRGDVIPRSARPIAIGSSATGFTCGAVGNLDNDPALDYWYINDARVIVNESSDL
jgi:hypothetical protein